MGKIKTVLIAIGVGVLSFFVGYVKGYDTGFNEGSLVGQIRELVNQGYTVEDASYIAKQRERLTVGSQEMFKSDSQK